MEIIETTIKDYIFLFPNPYHCFNAVNFNELNKYKCDEIKYLIFKDNKVRLGLILGFKENKLISPFSAPFGGFSFFDDEIQIQKIEEAIVELDKYCKEKEIKTLKVTLPPLFYDQQFIAKCISCFNRNNFHTNYIDLNYSFNTNKFNDKYTTEILWRNARKNYNIAQKNNFQFKKSENTEDFKTAYDVIKQNRKTRGFPLKMSYEQLVETTSIIKKDSFLLFLENKAVASAIVFHVATNIVQIIYWGDIPKYSDKKTMNYLSYKVFEYYKNQNIKIVDIGPSTEDGIPNYGLCEFKESIGCDISLKYTFTKDFI